MAAKKMPAQKMPAKKMPAKKMPAKKASSRNKQGPADDLRRAGSATKKAGVSAAKIVGRGVLDLARLPKMLAEATIEATPSVTRLYAVPAAKAVAKTTPGIAVASYLRNKKKPTPKGSGGSSKKK